MSQQMDLSVFGKVVFLSLTTFSFLQHFFVTINNNFLNIKISLLEPTNAFHAIQQSGFPKMAPFSLFIKMKGNAKLVERAVLNELQWSGTTSDTATHCCHDSWIEIVRHRCRVLLNGGLISNATKVEETNKQNKEANRALLCAGPRNYKQRLDSHMTLRSSWSPWICPLLAMSATTDQAAETQ